MSDVNEKEEQLQARLARAYKEYLIAVIAFIVGLAVFMYGWNGGRGDTKTLTMIIGWLIMGGPVFLKILKSRSMKGLISWRDDEEIITTYRDGHKESDAGDRIIVVLIVEFIAFILSGVLAFLRIVLLTIFTISCYVLVKEKPAFLRSPFPVLILFVVLFFPALGIPLEIRRAQANAYNKAYGLDEPEIEQGTILEDDDGRGSITIYAEADYWNSEVVRELNVGETVTATGKAIEKDDRPYIPVDYNGTTGWVDAYGVRADMPIIATAVVSADETEFYYSADEESGVMERFNKGDTVNVIGKEKRGFTPIEADVLAGRQDGKDVFGSERGFIKTEDLTIQP